MKTVGTIVGWLISIPCLAYVGYLIFNLVTLSRDEAPLSWGVSAVILPFYLAIGLAFNPLVFTRLPFARGFWSRLAIAVLIVALGLGAAWLLNDFLL